jgi:hypothetical protein
MDLKKASLVLSNLCVSYLCLSREAWFHCTHYARVGDLVVLGVNDWFGGVAG